MSGQRAAEKLADGDYYEANQLYRTVFHRLLKKGETEEALRVAHEATVALLKHKQAPSATDMALLLIDAFKSQALAVDDKTRGIIVDIFKNYEPQDVQRDRFLEAALKWASKTTGSRHGDAQLRGMIGQVLAEQDDFPGANEHLQLGTPESAETLAKLMFDHGVPQEREELLLRSVLAFLNMQNLASANAYYSAFTNLTYNQDPTLRVAQSSVPTSSAADSAVTSRTVVTSKLPLYNFALFLLLLAERKASAQHFANLRRHYQPAIKKDPAFGQMLDRVGEIYFGTRPAQPQQPNMLGNIGNLMRMMGGPAQ